MKKILFYIIIFVIICFGIPILFTNKKDNTKEVSTIQENVQSNEQNEIKEYDYKQYNKIKLLHKQSTQVEEMPLDEYLYGVVSAEMPASFEK